MEASTGIEPVYTDLQEIDIKNIILKSEFYLKYYSLRTFLCTI